MCVEKFLEFCIYFLARENDLDAICVGRIPSCLEVTTQLRSSRCFQVSGSTLLFCFLNLLFVKKPQGRDNHREASDQGHNNEMRIKRTTAIL